MGRERWQDLDGLHRDLYGAVGNGTGVLVKRWWRKTDEVCVRVFLRS